MGAITLTDAVTLTEITSALINNNNTTLENLLNGGLEESNFSAGKLYSLTKLLQGSAATGDLLRWDGTDWAKFTPPSCSATQSGSASISNTTDTLVSLAGTEGWDSSTMHDTVTNPSRITIPTGGTGVYLLVANVAWGTDSAGSRHTYYRVNGGSWVTITEVAESSGTAGVQVSASIMVSLTAADYVELGVRQSSGGNLTLNSATFQVTYLGHV